MLGKISKKIAISLFTSALLVVTLIPTFTSAYTYQGRGGHNFNDANFYFSNTSVDTQQFFSTARFCWQTPEKYHEGFAVYLTEGDFHGGLNNYSPQFMPVGSNCVTKYMPQGGKVSFRAYPYINLESGARKYLQPGYKAEFNVKVDQELEQPVITHPAQNQTLTNYPRRAFLSWGKVDGASKYEIQLACDVCTSSSVKWLNPTTYTSSKNYFYTPALPGDNQFRFQVRAVAANGEKSDWSDYSYFRYNTSSHVQPKPQPVPQPAPQPPVFVDEAISVSITDWSGGSPKLDWTDYKGIEHGYKIIVAPGYLTKDQLLTKQGFFVGTQPSEYQLSKLYANTSYSTVVIPYRWSYGTRRPILNAASNVLHFTTAANEPAPQMSCGDSSDGDGLYSACTGDTIHHSSGAKLKVVKYTDTYVQLSVSGAWPYNVYVFKNSSKELQIKNGTRLKVTYTETSDKFGAFIRVETTKGPDPVAPVLLPAVSLSVNNSEAGSVKLDWNDIRGLGSTFDKYHIKWSKGWVSDFDTVNHAKSYVSYGSYYNLGGLDSGWWSFQVVPTKNGVEVASRSQIVRVYVY